MNSRRALVPRTLVSCLVLLTGLSFPLAAEEPASIQLLGRELYAIENLVRNSEIKLKNGISGGSLGTSTPGDEGKAAFRTPAQSCCSANIRNIREKAQSANAMIEQMTVRFQKESDRAAVGLLGQLRENLVVVQQGIVAFERAGSQGRAYEALAGMTRPITRMRSASRGLAVCCSRQTDPLEPVKTDQPRKKKKKKSRG